MRVIELLEEIEEIVDTASGVILTGKIMVDPNELLEIVKEIKNTLPDEIQQAQWIVNDKDRILGEAKEEYETVLKSAHSQAEDMVENNEIMVRAKKRAQELMEQTDTNVRQLKMSTYDYVDGILFDFQEKMSEMSTVYFADMFNKLETAFNEVNGTLASNRDEIKGMAYRTSMDLENDEDVLDRVFVDEDSEEDYREKR